MPWNDRKIISISRRSVTAWRSGLKVFREEITEVVADILEYERQHRVSATNIQKKINDKCNATARPVVE